MDKSVHRFSDEMTVQELLDGIAVAALKAGLDARVTVQIVTPGSGGGVFTERDPVEDKHVVVIAIAEKVG